MSASRGNVVGWAVGILLLALAVGCARGDDAEVVIRPDPEVMLPEVPSDPFGAPSLAYEQLRSITETARTTNWNGNVDDLAGWLEAQTLAVEQSLALMKALRLGTADAYAVANGRVALLYEHIASTLTDAELAVKDRELHDDWLGQQAVLWEQANGYWARCARGASLSGPYLDAWELRCEAGELETAARFDPQIAGGNPLDTD